VTELAVIVPLSDQIACEKREIAMRERAYPRWVSGGRMTQQKANRELAAMRAVAETLGKLQTEGRLT
jgi:hypothetical protein